MRYIDMNIDYWFYNFFIILEIKVDLISYSLSKATSEAAENNGLIGLTRPTQPPACSTPARVGYWQTDDGYYCKQHFLVVVRLMGVPPMCIHHHNELWLNKCDMIRYPCQFVFLLVNLLQSFWTEIKFTLFK